LEGVVVVVVLAGCVVVVVVAGAGGVDVLVCGGSLTVVWEQPQARARVAHAIEAMIYFFMRCLMDMR
jgi:hypothetical protein